MATPANRVPVRIARGSKANLDTAIAASDLKEGEICYATDENDIYVVEGGALTLAGVDLASTSIDALSDVDTTTAASTDGQVLIWNNVDGEWQPGDRLADVVSDTAPQLGGNLDVNGNYIVSASGGNVEVAPDTTGDFVVRGNDTDGSVTLNCTTNAHGVKIQSPPHSAAASYTLVLPDDTGTSGQALVTDGSGGLSWAAPSADLSATSIDALSDVDTTTVAPTDGQALVWDNAASQWEPGTVGADLSTSSIDALSDVDTTTVAPTDGQALVWDNTASQWEPGTVASGSVTSLDDIGDVDTTTVPPTDGQALVWDNTAGQWEPGTVSGGGGGTTINEAFSTDSGYIHEYSYGSSTTIGEIQLIGSDIYLNWIDQNDRDTRTYISELQVNGGTVYWSTDGTTWTQYAWTAVAEISSQPRWYVSGGTATGFPSSGTVYIAFVLTPQNGSLVSPDAIVARDGTGWSNSGTLPKIEGADVNYSQTLRYDAFISNAPTAQGEIGTVPTNTSYLRIYETDADGRRVDPSKLRGNPTTNSQSIPVLFLWVDGTRNRIEPINTTEQFVYQSNYYQVDTKQDISTICSGASEIFVEIPGTPTNSASLRWNESLSRWESDPTTARVTRSTVPSTNADAGYPGEMRHDATYLYVCVEEDTWKRVAWDTW